MAQADYPLEWPGQRNHRERASAFRTTGLPSASHRSHCMRSVVDEHCGNPGARQTPSCGQGFLTNLSLRSFPQPHDIVLVFDPDQRADDNRENEKLLPLLIDYCDDRE
jgi:hypothetical protein